MSEARHVGGAALKRGEDGGVDQANDGADVFFAGELFDGYVFVGAVVAGEDVEGEAFAGFIENALRLLGFFEQVSDLREGGDAGDDAMGEEAGDLVENHEARGVADGDDEGVFALLDGDEVVAEHQLDGNGAEEVVLDAEVFEVDEFGVIAAGECLGARAFFFRRGLGDDGERDDGSICHSGLAYPALVAPSEKMGR
jgi:hypothetical protein